MPKRKESWEALARKWNKGFTRGQTKVHPRSDKDLAKLGPVKTVIQCARDVGLIDDARFASLTKMADPSHTSQTDGHTASSTSSTAPTSPNLSEFSIFVAPEDQLVQSPSQAVDIPAGSFLAFIEVDQNTPGPMGERNLVHAMIALGGGKAIGFNNHPAIGIGSTDKWEECDLEHLSWIQPEFTSQLDDINGVPLSVNKARPLRLRYAPAHKPEWGNPRASSAVGNMLVKGAKLSRGPNDAGDLIEIQSAKDSPGDIRVAFSFRVSRLVFETFFNSPDGMRGHYYADAQKGDDYVKAILTRVATDIDLSEIQYDRKPLDDTMKDAVRKSIGAGKMWAREDITVKTHWPTTAGTGVKYFETNGRWVNDPRRKKGNYDMLEKETNLKRLKDASAVIKALQKKFLDDNQMSNKGAQYFKWYDDSVAPFIDVKGAWINASTGKVGEFVPDHKRFRGHQIKWFGYT